MSLKEDILSRGIKKDGLHICVLGVIGSGKTTVSNHLKRVIEEREGRCELLLEPVETNPLLELYYADPSRFAFSMQVKMLTRRFAQQKIAQSMTKNGVSCVQDSSMFGDCCFVQMLCDNGTIPDVEVDVYSDLFSEMSEFIKYPSAVVILHCQSDVALQRIKKRCRKCEQGIPKDYLDALNEQLVSLSETLRQYTYVINVNANQDLTDDRLFKEAESLYLQIKNLRKEPILSRIGE